jgi:tetrahydromethanopterin S-methyltransferase subunit G
MSEKLNHNREDLRNGLVQLRFSDEAGNIRDINAAEMAESLLGLVELSGQMARAGLYGEGVPPEIRVRPPEKGSFIIEAIVHWAAENPEGAMTVAGTAGGALTQAINVGLKVMRGGAVEDWEYLDNGDVKLKWKDGATPTQVPEPVWKELQKGKKQTRRALGRIMAPLGDDADRLEVRDGRASETTSEVLESPPEVVASKDDYRAAVQKVDEISEYVSEFEAEAQLQSIDFTSGENHADVGSSGCSAAGARRSRAGSHVQPGDGQGRKLADDAVRPRREH